MKFLLAQHFYIQKAGLNPFKNIYKVQVLGPEHRSAFTYWEEDIPRRILEDTKTFLRILPSVVEPSRLQNIAVLSTF